MIDLSNLLEQNCRILADKTIAAQKIKSQLTKHYTFSKDPSSKLSVIIGGDGFMLNKIKSNLGKDCSFYGINSGNLGFLMNSAEQLDLHKVLVKTTKYKLFPLELKAKLQNNNKKKLYAVNEISLYRISPQTVRLKIYLNNITRMADLWADGIIIATPAGSTAYNMSAHGSILPLNSKALVLTPLSPFRPRRWRGAIISNDDTIKIEVEDYKKRPVIASADNKIAGEIKSIEISESKTNCFTLLYNGRVSLYERNITEQFFH